MTDIDRYIELLKSADKNKRYQACEELGVVSNLPEKAIVALRETTNDSDASVAKAAKQALALHTPELAPDAVKTEEQSKAPKKKISITDWIWRIIAAIFLLITLFVVLAFLSLLVLPCGIFGC